MLNILLNNFFYIKLNFNNLITILIKEIINYDFLMFALISYFNFFVIYNFYNLVYHSRKKYISWFKGKNSDNYQILKNIYIDCDMDSIIIEILQLNNLSCHINLDNCFLNKI